MTDLFDDEDLDTDELISINARIQSIPSLRLDRFKKVARLCLRQNGITEINGLECLAETLVDLDLYDNLIGHIRGLESLTKLTNLDLSFNKIKHIKRVNHLIDLTDLFFVANKISTIENLEGLEKLRMLELASNRIREIQNLDSLKNLEELWLAKNKITTLGGLSELPKLRLLSIQSNRIRDLSPLKDVPTLEELYISHNALESLEGLGTNTKLRVLEISNNQITSLQGLGPLKELEEVWASYNKLSDFADVEKELKDKENLETVYFEGNPLQTRAEALYRNKVRLALPQIKQIDASKFEIFGDFTFHALTASNSLCANMRPSFGCTQRRCGIAGEAVAKWRWLFMRISYATPHMKPAPGTTLFLNETCIERRIR